MRTIDILKMAYKVPAPGKLLSEGVTKLKLKTGNVGGLGARLGKAVKEVKTVMPKGDQLEAIQLRNGIGNIGNTPKPVKLAMLDVLKAAGITSLFPVSKEVRTTLGALSKKHPLLGRAQLLDMHSKLQTDAGAYTTAKSLAKNQSTKM